MAKEPKLVTCTFLQPWRGHAQGAVADLTQERAAELLEEGVVVEGEKKLTKPAAKTSTTTTNASTDAGGDAPTEGDKPKGPPVGGRRRGKEN